MNGRSGRWGDGVKTSFECTRWVGDKNSCCLRRKNAKWFGERNN